MEGSESVQINYGSGNIRSCGSGCGSGTMYIFLEEKCLNEIKFLRQNCICFYCSTAFTGSAVHDKRGKYFSRLTELENKIFKLHMLCYYKYLRYLYLLVTHRLTVKFRNLHTRIQAKGTRNQHQTHKRHLRNVRYRFIGKSIEVLVQVPKKGQMNATKVFKTFTL
jgi:hypothetical protein